MGVVWASGHAMGIGLNSSSFLFSLLSHFDQQTSRRPVEGIMPAFFKDLCVSSTLAHIFKTGKNPAVKTSGVCNNSAQGMIRKTHIAAAPTFNRAITCNNDHPPTRALHRNVGISPFFPEMTRIKGQANIFCIKYTSNIFFASTFATFFARSGYLSHFSSGFQLRM